MRPALEAFALLLVACAVGTTGGSYEPAQGPAGATVTLELTGQREMVGELLAVEDTALLVRQDRQLVRVPLRLILSGKAPKVSFTGQLPAGEPRERLRLISRYPQGVSAELEARLLEAYGQSRVREVDGITRDGDRR
jgi:hypothetical protein